MDFSRHSPRIPSRGFRRWEKAGIRTFKAGELYDAAFAIYSRSGGDLLRLIALPAAITLGMLVLAWHLVGRHLFTTDNPDSISSQATELIGLLTIGTVATAPLILLAYSYMSACVALYVSQRHHGQTPNLGAVHRAILRSVPKLAVLNLIILIAVFGGLVVGFGLILLSALIEDATAGEFWATAAISASGVVGLLSSPVIGVFFYVRYCLAPVALVVEGVPARTALGRSRALMSGKGEATATAVGLLLLTVLVQLLLWVSLRIPFGLLREYALSGGLAEINIIVKALYEVINLAALFLSFLLAHPALVCGLTLLYYDRRVRTEGYDIELLAQNVWKSDRSAGFQL